ncbi:hypothetical protein [Mycobacterium tuberculosis]|uniref:hypothetical protein n=1 Tax=Mycobacterium tuberculosis TaxID=1773 RepID=UPI0012DC23AE|nr:hypothetical protein [Mycobacterium tuberculosis]
MKVTVMVKDGGYESIQISPEMLGELANRIVKDGSEWVHTMTKSYEVVGILVKGPQIGDRVIMTGSGLET